MKITRKDTVIIAVLVNISLLAVFVATASKWEKEDEAKAEVSTAKIVAGDTKITFLEEAKPLTIYSNVEEKSPVDEIDQVLQEYALKQKVVPVAKTETKEVEKDDGDDEVVKVTPKDKEEGFFTVVVKKDDVLSKIAKAHGVTVNEIMKLNALANSKLRIGQSLKIPTAKKKPTLTSQVPACISDAPNKASDGEYYVIKDGDNPWKIARRFHLKYEDLLTLNNLDEDKAKNLKIGQRIRIR